MSAWARTGTAAAASTTWRTLPPCPRSRRGCARPAIATPISRRSGAAISCASCARRKPPPRGRRAGTVDDMSAPTGKDEGDRAKVELVQAALRESEQRFRRISDSAPVPMWVTKLDRKRGFVNIAYAEFLGVPYD